MAKKKRAASGRAELLLAPTRTRVIEVRVDGRSYVQRRDTPLIWNGPAPSKWAIRPVFEFVGDAPAVLALQQKSSSPAQSWEEEFQRLADSRFRLLHPSKAAAQSFFLAFDFATFPNGGRLLSKALSKVRSGFLQKLFFQVEAELPERNERILELMWPMITTLFARCRFRAHEIRRGRYDARVARAWDLRVMGVKVDFAEAIREFAAYQESFLDGLSKLLGRAAGDHLREAFQAFASGDLRLPLTRAETPGVLNCEPDGSLFLLFAEFWLTAAETATKAKRQKYLDLAALFTDAEATYIRHYKPDDQVAGRYGPASRRAPGDVLSPADLGACVAETRRLAPVRNPELSLHPRYAAIVFDL